MGGVHELDGTGKEELISIPSSGFYGQKSKLTGYQNDIPAHRNTLFGLCGKAYSFVQDPKALPLYYKNRPVWNLSC
jgi:hypothetical protein